MASEYIVREAKREDCQAIRGLIQELADYEKMPNGPKITTVDLEKDGFGEHPFYRAFIAEIDNKVIGYCIYFYIYSTWEGKALYIEDIYVQEHLRGRGIGSAFLKSVAKAAVKSSCCRLELSVLNWNEPSRKFYESRGAIDLTESEGWNKYRFNSSAIQVLAEN